MTQSEALTTADEVLTIRRSMAEQDPDRYGPQLARTLHLTAGTFARADQTARAIEHTGEAVRILRPLAEAIPKAHLTDLACALHNDAFWRGRASRPAEALTAIDECIAIYAALSAEIPRAFDKDRGQALHVRAEQLRALGRTGEADADRLEARRLTSEAVASRRSVMVSHSDLQTM